ncbi:MAG: hypothetical protein Q7J29_03290 [Stagnimonas sp.]|nr:hypothetical protein [Stagnimonas sp.]
MSSTLKSVVGAVALSSVLGLVGGCASGGGQSATQSAGGESEYTGIQTRAIRAAPASQQARNESKPLSELNTPAAVAAREAAPRSPPPRQAAPAPAPAVAVAVAAAAAPTPTSASAPAHQQIEVLQKGAKVRAYGNASLRARPSTKSDGAPVAPNIDLELGPQIYNADGYWWYVTAGKESGWLLQADIQR